MIASEILVDAHQIAAAPPLTVLSRLVREGVIAKFRADLVGPTARIVAAIPEQDRASVVWAKSLIKDRLALHFSNLEVVIRHEGAPE